MNFGRFKTYEVKSTLNWIRNRLDTAEKPSDIIDKIIENIQYKRY